MAEFVSAMKDLLTLQFIPTKPFDFELTLHKRAGWYWLTPLEVYEDKTLWTGARLDSTLLGLKVQAKGTIAKPRLVIRIFAKEKLALDQKKQLRKFLETALKLKQDLKDFYSFSKKFPVLKEATKSLYGMHTASDPSRFHAAIRTVLSHMCRTERAIKMLDCLFKNYGEEIKFDGKEIILWPTKKRLNEISEKELRVKCNLGYRAKNLKLLVLAAVKGTFPEREELLKLSPEDAKKKLMEFKGIGDYSAEILSPHPGFPLDVWSVMIFWKLLGIKKDRPTKEMIPKVKKWAEKNWGSWRSLAFTYILNDLDNLKEKFKVDISGTIADYIKEKKEAKKK